MLVALPLLSACGYNTIPTAEENAKAAWSEVLNQYQRRADLIPNLVETVKGYATHEKDVLEGVVEARAKATQVTVSPETLSDPEAFKKFQDSQSGLTSALVAGCSPWSRTIPTSRPTRISWRCRRSLKARRTASRSPAATTSRRCASTTPSLKTFPSVLWATFWFTNNEPFQNFTVAEDKIQTPKVDFGSGN